MKLAHTIKTELEALGKSGEIIDIDQGVVDLLQPVGVVRVARHVFSYNFV